MSSFVHLHVHTHYSLLDGATRIGALVDRAKRLNMPALAVTDHGNLFGAIEFYTAARKAGVKPIIGYEAYLATGDRRSKDPGRSASGGAYNEPAIAGSQTYHLLLLAMNLEGYHNLMRLASIGYTEGFYRKPRIDKEVLRELSGGLVCTSTCLGGEIPQALLKRDQAAAEALAKTYLEIFGPDRFFIELQDHGLPEQRMLNPELLDMAKRLGVAAIATNDVHYLEHDDVEAHDVLCCINTGSLVSDEDRFKFEADQFYFKSSEEMSVLFANCPEVIANTLRVADLCNLELDLSRRHAPAYRVPEDVTDDSGRALDAAGYLRRLVHKGAEDRYGEITPELRERIDYELEVITSKGFASYFLIVWDCVRYARGRGIPVAARGSGCSSVVSYCLRISVPDPIRYGLYFERFMDPDRDEMPDIDLDICQNGRGELIEYVRQKYGHVAQIITFGTLKAKAVIKDVARVLGMGFDEANQLTKLIPFDLKMTLDKALDQEPELKKRYNDDPAVRRIVDIGRRLEGVARNAGVHAAGVVVADQPLTNFLPLYRADGQDTLVTQYDGPTVEKVGLLKMDFLGLRTLTTLERARQLAQRSTGDSIDLEHLDLADASVYDLFARGDTQGIFQFESGGMRDVIMRMKPNRIEDLIAANALYRPGPMEYIPEYIARKHGASWTTPHPIMTEVLEETYGIMVYQEQVSRLVNRLGGIELKEAFRLAKAISKKKTSMIEAMREPFLGGCVANGVKRPVAEKVFEDVLKFGGYAFNKAHSTGYALIAFQTAWMKTYYPMEFMAALMTFEMSSTEKVAEYRQACKKMGIAVAPPDINASEYDFIVETSKHRNVETSKHRNVETSKHQNVETSKRRNVETSKHQNVETSKRRNVDRTPVLSEAKGRVTTGELGTGDRSSNRSRNEQDVSTFRRFDVSAFPRDIRFGLGAIKGVGQKATDAIVEAREQGGRYRDLFDFCERVDLTAVNCGSLEALVCAGAFDRTGAMRKALFDAIERAMNVGQAVQRDRRSGQMTMFGAPDDRADAAVPEVSLSKDEWGEAEMLAREKAVLGFYITHHPLTSFEPLVKACATASTVDLARFEEDDKVVLGGVVSSVRTVTARNGRNAGKKLGIVTLEDLKGRVEAILFPKDFAAYQAVLAPDEIVFLEGSVDKKREEPSLRVSRVVPAKEAVREFAAALLLDVTAMTPIERLIETLKSHGAPSTDGSRCPVVLDVETADGYVAQIQSNPSLRVACEPALLAELVRLLGCKSVCVLGPNRRAIPF